MLFTATRRLPLSSALCFRRISFAPAAASSRRRSANTPLPFSAAPRTRGITMALAPKFKGHRLVFYQANSNAPDPLAQLDALHTVEIYLDYVCPFSAKIFNTVLTSVAPAIRANPKLASRVQFIFRQQVQPWHPSSTLVHEAAIAVERLAPDRFWEFSDALFKAQKEYFDVSVVNETRNQTYRRLAKLGASAAGVSEDELYSLLEIPTTAAPDGSLNIGNKITNDFKLHVRAARLVGVHVSPTVIFDGIVANDISSSWTKEQWLEWLEKNVA